MGRSFDWNVWQPQIERFLEQRIPEGDPAHDMEHIRRVVATAAQLARAEEADLEVVLPSAWLHDCVVMPKDSLMRTKASTLAAQVAADFLRTIGYPEQYLQDIHHAISAHSFSSGIVPRTREAMVVRDADFLDALGAIGIARCLMLASTMGQRLYDPAEPIPQKRQPDDRQYTIDHFYIKLLRLADMMHTSSGRAEADTRTAFMRAFLEQLSSELPAVH
jgi:uncharacterized protein